MKYQYLFFLSQWPCFGSTFAGSHNLSLLLNILRNHWKCTPHIGICIKMIVLKKPVASHLNLLSSGPQTLLSQILCNHGQRTDGCFPTELLLGARYIFNVVSLFPINVGIRIISPGYSVNKRRKL